QLTLPGIGRTGHPEVGRPARRSGPAPGPPPAGCKKLQPRPLSSTGVKAIRRLHVRTVLPQTLAPLHDLALNLRWSWHPPTRDIFASIDPELWRASGQD